MADFSTTAPISNEMRDRAAGCLVGAALGDAFGMPLEFAPPPDAQVRDFRSGRLPAGTFTDDTEMMLALASSLLAHRPLDPVDLSGRFLEWLRRRPSDIGIHTREVLDRVNSGMPWKKAVMDVQSADPDSAGNGSVMRCFPVALAYHEDLTACIATSQLQSRVTHAHAECQAACAFVNAVIWHALRGAGARQAVDDALESLPDMPAALRDSIEKAPSLEARELRNTGWVRHTVESAVWGLLTTQNYPEAVIRVANLGQDADTAAAVAGAMAGAVYGLRAIPQDWQTQLRGAWPIRTDRTWRAPHFSWLAQQLLEGRQFDLEATVQAPPAATPAPAVQSAPAAPAPVTPPAAPETSATQAPEGEPDRVVRPPSRQTRLLQPALRMPGRGQFRGALLGGAVGDALGLPFEGQYGAMMRSRHGRVDGYTGLHGRPAKISDDTQLTVVVAECLLANGWLDPADLARRMVEWLSYKRGEGKSTLEAVERMQAGTPWHQAASERSGGNGAAMRAAPVGLVYWNNPPRLMAEAVLSSLPTHTQPVGVAGAVAMAAATAWLLTHPGGSWSPEEFIAAVQVSIAGLEITLVEDRKNPDRPTTLHDRIGELPALLGQEPARFFDRFYSGGFVLESLPAAFYCFLRSPENVEQSILTAVNYARDTDTVAALAGTLGGALCGVEAMPQDLVAGVEGRAELTALADRLWELAERR